MNLQEIKDSTIQGDNIRSNDGFYRFINHKYKLATTGFKSLNSLLKYKDNLRFDDKTIVLMKNRYKEMYK